MVLRHCSSAQRLWPLQREAGAERTRSRPLAATLARPAALAQRPLRGSLVAQVAVAQRSRPPVLPGVLAWAHLQGVAARTVRAGLLVQSLVDTSMADLGGPRAVLAEEAMPMTAAAAVLDTLAVAAGALLKPMPQPVGLSLAQAAVAARRT